MGGDAGWGKRFTNDLSRLKATTAEVEKLKESWKRLQSEMSSGMGKAFQTSAISSWKSQALGALIAVRQEAQRLAQAQVNAANKAAAAQQRAAQRMAGVGHFAVGALGLGGAAYGVNRAARYTATQGAEAERESVRQHFAGFTPGQIAETNAHAFALSRQFPTVGALDIRKHQRNITSVVGSYDEASHLMELVTRAQAVLQVQRGQERAAGDLEALVKAGEVLNRAQSARVLTPLVTAFIKSANLYGDTVRGEDWRQYAATAKTSVVGLNDSFLTGVIPSMMQEFGGERTGTMQMTALGNLARRPIKKAQVAALRKAGLLDRDGRISGARAGLVDPLAFANSFITGALQRSGVDVTAAKDIAHPGSQEARTKMVELMAQWFTDRNAAEFFSKLILDRPKFEKNMKQASEASGPEAADKVRQDPFQAWQSVKEQMDNLVQVASSPLMPTAAKGLSALADGIANLTKAALENPDIAKKAAVGGFGLFATAAPWLTGAGLQGLAGRMGDGATKLALQYGGTGLKFLGRMALIPSLAMTLEALTEDKNGDGFFSKNLGRIRRGFAGTQTEDDKRYTDQVLGQNPLRGLRELLMPNIPADQRMNDATRSYIDSRRKGSSGADASDAQSAGASVAQSAAQGLGQGDASAQKMMNDFAQSIASGGTAAVAQAQSIMSQIQAIFSQPVKINIGVNAPSPAAIGNSVRASLSDYGTSPV
ncbi:hypothetical protein [Terrarubrum flagellatum]|uniref:hypothetical protein n=1 Tax=Terrirubrum flagellatum TaxID=2895980 RepID=UPI0031452AFF